MMRAAALLCLALAACVADPDPDDDDPPTRTAADPRCAPGGVWTVFSWGEACAYPEIKPPPVNQQDIHSRL
jgi:hypothetical protein